MEISQDEPILDEGQRRLNLVLSTLWAFLSQNNLGFETEGEHFLEAHFSFDGGIPVFTLMEVGEVVKK